MPRDDVARVFIKAQAATLSRSVSSARRVTAAMTAAGDLRVRRGVAATALVALTVAAAVSHCGGATALRRSYLDEDEQFLLEWESNSTDITFTVTVNTTGWIGLGFSPSGGMAGSDIVTGWIKDDGTAVIQDRHATGRGTPEVDKQQDYAHVRARKQDGKTSMVFTRKISTCDPDDTEITADTMRLIYAYGSDIPTERDPPYHGTHKRGVRSVALVGLLPSFENTTNTIDADIVPPMDISLPSDSTIYWCSLIKFPDFENKVHMIKWEPFITQGNKGVVHHMALYGCYDRKNRSDHQGQNASFSCSVSRNMPPVALECSQLIAVWAIGGDATVLPEDVGLPFDDDNYPGYVLLQTHYDNPENKAGILDRSGFRITVTPALRKFEAGVLVAGHDLSAMIIPPRQERFDVHGYCSSPCTNAALPEEGINIFGGFLHSHLLGRQLFARHYRANIELTPLLVDMNYDFNYQAYRSVNPVVRVLPGDTLHLTCRMNSTSRTKVTFGGEATMDEMCYAYFLYYPKVSLTICDSVHQWQLGQGTLFKELNITATDDWIGGRYAPLDSVDWRNSANVKIIQDHYNDKDDVVTGCRKSFLSPIEAGSDKYWTPPIERKGAMPQSRSACSDSTNSDASNTNAFSTSLPQGNRGLISYSSQVTILLMASLSSVAIAIHSKH